MLRPRAGSGVASRPPMAGPVTHYNARRFAELGDLVLAVTRILDPVAMTPERLELRAFLAGAPGRAELMAAGPDQLLASEGGMAWVGIDLQCQRTSFPWDAPAERVARLERLHLQGAGPADRAVHAVNGLADWLAATWEHELTFGTWYAVRGDARCLERRDALVQSDDPARSLRTGDFGAWAATWLAGREYAVTTEPPGDFLKVLNGPLLARIESGQLG